MGVGISTDMVLVYNISLTAHVSCLFAMCY